MAVFRRWKQVGTCLSYQITVAPSADSPVDQTVLIMIDAPENDGDTDHVIDDLQGDGDVSRLATYENVISFALADEKDRPKAVRIILACPDAPAHDSTYHVECLRLLTKVKPDAVLFSGHRVSKAMFGAAWQKRYGYLKWATFEATTRNDHTYTYECDAAVTIPVWGWTSPYPTMKGDEGGGFVNLIGQFIQHLQTGIRGANRYKLKVPNVQDLIIQTVDTMDKFDAFYDRLLETDIPVFDTETESLNRKVNKILTFQWLLPTETGWYDLFFIPFDHKESTWLPEERQIIKQKLRRYFENVRSTYIIGAGLKFDIVQITNQLGVRWLNHRVYDIQAGEFVFDENLKFLSKFVGKPFALDGIERRYGYERPIDVMDKEDRKNMASQPLEVIRDYGMLDVITPWHIHYVQIQEAKRRGYTMFKRLVADQLGNTIISMASMEARGMMANAAHLQRLVMPDSEINTTIQTLLDRFKNSEAAIRINDRMVEERGWQSVGMFGTNEKPWLFDISKKAHQEELFFDELRLEPLRHGKLGEGSTDKAFQAAYIHVPEVQWFQDLSKMLTIKQNFVDTLHDRLVTEPDALNDGRIRPTFDYRYVLTGRSSSRDPNSQNQPSRGKLAKIVKGIWIAPTGKVLLKPDFNAHEVRGFGTAGADPVVTKVFGLADDARIALRTVDVPAEVATEVAETYIAFTNKQLKWPEFSEKLKALGADDLLDALSAYQKQGDVHIQNVKFFFGQDVDKSHPLRYAIKAVVFGVIYGKGPKSLGIELRGEAKKRMEGLEKDVAKLVADKAPEKTLAAKEAELAEATKSYNRDERTWTKESKGLIEKLFETWKVGGNWIKGVHKRGLEDLVVFSLIGMPRHLWPYLHASEAVQAAMNRRGPNSLIQGFSSQSGFTSSWLIARETWHTFTKQGIDLGFLQHNSVHDSMTFESHFAAVPIAIYLIEHGMTSLVFRHYEETYGAKISVPFGVGLEIGLSEADMTEWEDQRFDTMAIYLKQMHAKTMKAQAEAQAALLPGQEMNLRGGKLLTNADLDDALHNLRKIAAIRMKELRTDPFTMLLEGNTDWYLKHMRGLHVAPVAAKKETRRAA